MKSKLSAVLFLIIIIFSSCEKNDAPPDEFSLPRKLTDLRFTYGEGIAEDQMSLTYDNLDRLRTLEIRTVQIDNVPKQTSGHYHVVVFR